MAEPAIKRKILTKVRKNFLHKGPPDDDEVENHTNLIATPEQLNYDTTCLLEPSIGLVETNRTIYAGVQNLNSHYKVTTVKIDDHLNARTVTLNLKINDIILPWEYRVKRLESFGNLELATWANKLKAYYEAYPQIMGMYYGMMKPENLHLVQAMMSEKAQADLSRKELESNHAYCKVSVFANKDGITPVSLTYNEKMLKDLGHDINDFVEWVNDNGIPKLFEGDSILHMELSKLYLNTTSFGRALFQEGPEFKLYLYDKEGEKKFIKVKLFYAVDPTPEGFFINVYMVRKYDESNVPVLQGEEDSQGFENKTQEQTIETGYK